MPKLGPWELGIILLIVLAIFGAGKLSSLGGAVGKAVHDFRRSVKDESGKDEDAAKAESASSDNKEES